MKVAGTGHGAPAGVAHGAKAPDRPEPAPAAPPPSPAPTDAGAAEGGGRGPTKLAEKLASGHFNDVAAIRLRLNHADAITASGVPVPDVSETSSHPGRGFERALDAYRSAFPASPPAPEVDPDAGVEVVVDTPVSVAEVPVTETPAEPLDLAVLPPVTTDTDPLDALLEELTEPVGPDATPE